MVCDSTTYSTFHSEEGRLPSPTSTAVVMHESCVHRKHRVCFEGDGTPRASHCHDSTERPSALALPSSSGSTADISSSLESPETQRPSRKRKLDELLIDASDDNEVVSPHSQCSSDPLCAEAHALWRKGPSCPKCAYCNSYRHEAHGCEHLVQRVSSLGRYFRDLCRSDPRRARGWFALYLRNCPDVSKLSCISEMLYRRACQQGVWRPIFTSKMKWPCVDENALRDFMVLCSPYPTLWMTPSELLSTKKALMHEAILLRSPGSSLSCSPRCSPTHEQEQENLGDHDQ